MWMDSFTINDVEVEIHDSTQDKANGLAVTDENGKLLDAYIPDTDISNLLVSPDDPLQMSTKDWIVRAHDTNYGTKHPVTAVTTTMQVSTVFSGNIVAIGYLPSVHRWLMQSSSDVYRSFDGISVEKVTQISNVNKFIVVKDLVFILCTINNQVAWFMTSDGQNFSATNLPTGNYSSTRMRIYYSPLFSAYFALDTYDENNSYGPLPSHTFVGLFFCSVADPTSWSAINTFSSDTIYSIHENNTYLVLGTTRGIWYTTEPPVFTQTESSQVQTETITSVTYLPSVDIWLAVYSGGNALLYSVSSGPAAWGFGVSIVHKHLKSFADVCYSFGTNNAGTSVVSKCTLNGTSWSTVSVHFSTIAQLPNGRFLASGSSMYYSDNKTSFTLATLDGAPFSSARLLLIHGTEAYAVSVASSPYNYCCTLDGENWRVVAPSSTALDFALHEANGVYTLESRINTEGVENLGLLKTASGTYFSALKSFNGIQLGIQQVGYKYAELGGVLDATYKLQLLAVRIPTHKAVRACDCSDSVICAVTDDGVYCSSDNNTYTLVLAGTVPTYFFLGYATKHNVWLYAADTKLYRSTNGIAWTESTTIIATSTSELMRETVHFLCYSRSTHLYYSQDAGITWQEYTFSENVTDVIETDSNALIVVLKTAVYKTTDYATWTLIFQQDSNSRHYSLHCAYTDSKLLLSNDVALYALTKISYNEGDTWQDVDNVASAVGTLREGLFYRIVRSPLQIQLSHNGTVWVKAPNDAQANVSLTVKPTPINADSFLVLQYASKITELHLNDFLYNPLT